MNLIDLRKEKGLTQFEIAERAGVPQQFYNYIENGRRRPSVSVAKKIAAVLGFDWTEFYDDDGESA